MYSGAHHTYNRTSQARQCTSSSREAMQYSSYKRHQPHRTTTTSTRKKINGHKSLRLADKQARGCLSTILPCKSVQNQAHSRCTFLSRPALAKVHFGARLACCAALVVVVVHCASAFAQRVAK